MSLGTTTRMLAPFLDRFTKDELDALPFGVIRLDGHGRIVAINAAESEAIQWSDGSALGRDYFTDVYPHACIAEMVDRFMSSFRDGELDETFRVTFLQHSAPRTALIRMYFSARTHSLWIFTGNPDGSPLRKAA